MLTPDPTLNKTKEAYAEILLEIRTRLFHAGELHYEDVTIGYRPMDIETIATTFRKIAELIIFANLIGHEQEYRAIYADIEDEWNMGKIINRIKKINPNYFPLAWGPLTEKVSLSELDNVIPDDILTMLVNIQETEVMTEAELIEMYGQCSDLIHARNPFKDKLEYDSYLDKFMEWGERLSNLLSSHTVTLADGKHILLGMMSPSDSELPHTEIFLTNDISHVNNKIHNRISGKS